MNQRRSAFELDPSLTYLNHASFGAPTGAALRRAAAERSAIERDTASALGPALDDRLREQAGRLGPLIGAGPGSLALVGNATEANAALASSLRLRPDDHVLLLDVEYPSVLRAWEVACARAGAVLDVMPLPLPATTESVLAALDGAHPATRVVVLSAITSATAAALPVREVAGLCHARGITFLVDAAHAVGHLPLDVAVLGADAVFGSLHKWLPVPRPVGFLWLADHLRDRVRPAAVSLTWDSDDLVTRFAWRGTWDPAPALGLADAIAEHDGWRREGLVQRAEDVADAITEGLSARGLRPTAEAGLLPPRLRAFLADGIDLARLRTALDDAAVRAWSGTAADGTTVLRVSTHVYNDPADLRPLVAALDAARS
jgi:isopenicillin-N epimerase